MPNTRTRSPLDDPSGAERPWDLVVWGATGFTGGLIAHHLAERLRQSPLTVPDGAGGARPVRWAIAGRKAPALQALAAQLAEIQGGEAPGVLVAQAQDPDSMIALCRSTRVVLSTVGPYQLYGGPLVAACAQTGTDYLDLCGEPLWMAEQIQQHHATAQASGARIVFSCGFDSIPFELGVWFLQRSAQDAGLQALQTVACRVTQMRGGVSGGTLASAIATIEAVRRQPSLRRAMFHPLTLCPGADLQTRIPSALGPSGPDYDPVLQGWTAPFVMASVNTKNVHRSHWLMQKPWGPDFHYDERQWMGAGPEGQRRASKAAWGFKAMGLVLGVRPLRRLMMACWGPKPGEGPSEKTRREGGFRLAFWGRNRQDQVWRVQVSGVGDPGYASTAQMMAETALLLVNTRATQAPASALTGGVWTPGALLGQPLVDALQTHAGLRFDTVPLNAQP